MVASLRQRLFSIKDGAKRSRCTQYPSKRFRCTSLPIKRVPMYQPTHPQMPFFALISNFASRLSPASKSQRGLKKGSKSDQTLPGFHHSPMKHVKVLKIGHSWDTFNSTSSRIIDCNCYLFIFRYVTFRCMFQTLSRPQSIDVSLNYSHSFNLKQFL